MPKDNEVDEKVRPVAWIVTNGGESCEPWLEYEQSEVDALPAVCIAEPLYSAATVAELRAKADAAERRVGELTTMIEEMREYVSDALHQEREAFKGYEHCSNIPTIEQDLKRIDDTLTGADPT